MSAVSSSVTNSSYSGVLPEQAPSATEETTTTEAPSSSGETAAPEELTKTIPDIRPDIFSSMEESLGNFKKFAVASGYNDESVFNGYEETLANLNNEFQRSVNGVSGETAQSYFDNITNSINAFYSNLSSSFANLGADVKFEKVTSRQITSDTQGVAGNDTVNQQAVTPGVSNVGQAINNLKAYASAIGADISATEAQLNQDLANYNDIAAGYAYTSDDSQGAHDANVKNQATNILAAVSDGFQNLGAVNHQKAANTVNEALNNLKSYAAGLGADISATTAQLDQSVNQYNQLVAGYGNVSDDSLAAYSNNLQAFFASIFTEIFGSFKSLGA